MIVQHLKRIPRTVSDREHGNFCVQLFGSIDKNASELISIDHQVCHLAVKTDFSAKPDDFFAHRRDHFRKHIGSDMWFLFVKDLFRRTESYKRFQDKAVPSALIFYKCIQFPVGKCACSALAELYVGLGF